MHAVASLLEPPVFCQIAGSIPATGSMAVLVGTICTPNFWPTDNEPAHKRIDHEYGALQRRDSFA